MARRDDRRPPAPTAPADEFRRTTTAGKAYREWLRRQLCAARTSNTHRCFGHVDPAEVKAHDGQSLVLVPLCQNAQSEKTAIGVRQFEVKHGLTLADVADACYDRYVAGRVNRTAAG